MYEVTIFFFNDTATTEIYTLSLHDALPIWVAERRGGRGGQEAVRPLRRLPLLPAEHPDPLPLRARRALRRDRKSTRLNSSHANISYAVFCLKKKNLRSFT